MGFKEEKKKIDEYVREYGVGAHVIILGIDERGRNIYKNDENGNHIFEIDNKNVFFSVIMMLFENRKTLMRLASNNRSDHNDEYESIFDEEIQSITATYNPDKEKGFVNFFLLNLNQAFLDAFDIDMIEVEDPDNPDKTKKESRLKSLEVKFDEEGEIVENPEIYKDMKNASPTEADAIDAESGILLAVNIIKLLKDRKKSQAKMYRIFFTEGIIYMMKYLDERLYEESRHSYEIYENLDDRLVDYIMVEDVTRLMDLIKSSFKKTMIIRDLIEKVTSNEEYISVYKKLFEIDHMSEKGLDIPECPFHASLIEAYMYYCDCIDAEINRTIPDMHGDAYVGKYRKQYREIVKEYQMGR